MTEDLVSHEREDGHEPHADLRSYLRTRRAADARLQFDGAHIPCGVSLEGRRDGVRDASPRGEEGRVADRQATTTEWRSADAAYKMSSRADRLLRVRREGHDARPEESFAVGLVDHLVGPTFRSGVQTAASCGTHISSASSKNPVAGAPSERLPAPPRVRRSRRQRIPCRRYRRNVGPHAARSWRRPRGARRVDGSRHRARHASAAAAWQAPR